MPHFLLRSWNVLCKKNNPGHKCSFNCTVILTDDYLIKKVNANLAISNMYSTIATRSIHTENAKPNLSLGGSCRGSGGSSSRGLGLLGRSHKRGLVCRSLESSVTELGRCVDELEFDLLQSNTLGTGNQSLERKETITLWSHKTSSLL
jgi:hypothetical protein